MADSSDVGNALVSLIGATLYPRGTQAPSAIGSPVQIFRGWPLSDAINQALAAGMSLVSIYPGDVEKNTTRYQQDWSDLAIPPTTLTVSVDAGGTHATIGGTMSVPQNVGVIVNGKPFLYAVQASDTLASIAAAIAALVSAATPATSSGATITIPAAHQLAGRVGTIGTSVMEVGRTEKQFQITLWCPTPALRDAAAKAIIPTLAKAERLALVNGTGARVVYTRQRERDDGAKDNLYRRDLFYTIEFPTVLIEADAQILAESVNIYAGVSAIGPSDPNLPLVATVTN